MTAEKVAAKPVRRTQAERSAATKAALTEAAIQTLYTHGYAATTTTMVAEAAGVSRGAMLHQFGTKVDLMIHVVQAVYENELDYYGKQLKGIRDPEEFLLATSSLVWEVLSRPSGIAVLEILQGSRSDPTLAERLGPAQSAIEKDSIENLKRRSGIDDSQALALTRLLVWSVRGLSVAKVLVPDPERIVDSVELLKSLLRNAISTGVLKIGVKPGKAD